MGRHTRVVCSTLARRGKSLTPESRMDILDERSAFDERRDDTQEASEFAMINLTPSSKRRSSAVAGPHFCLLYVQYLRANQGNKHDAERSAHPALEQKRPWIQASQNLLNKPLLQASTPLHTLLHHYKPQPPHTTEIRSLNNNVLPRQEIPRPLRYALSPSHRRSPKSRNPQP